jgi:hypothetical protein
MKQHRALDIAMSLCGWLTLPAMTLAYALGWPASVQNALATPIVVVVLCSAIVDRRYWRNRLRLLRNRLRGAQYSREARKTK